MLAGPLDDGTVWVVTIKLDAVPRFDDVLESGEWDRANRFARPSLRRRFVSAHGATRRLLGRMLNRPPASIRYELGCHGKPRLANPPIDLRFNLSHSGERALLALAVGREVGIDIEELRPIDVLALAEDVFSASERAALASVPPECRLDAFYAGWTRKESFIKARGEGLSFPLQAFDVSLEPREGQLLLACRHSRRDLEQWTIVSIPAESGYAAALTVEGAGFRTRQLEMW